MKNKMKWKLKEGKNANNETEYSLFSHTQKTKISRICKTEHIILLCEAANGAECSVNTGGVTKFIMYP